MNKQMVMRLLQRYRLPEDTVTAGNGGAFDCYRCYRCYRG